MSGSVPSSVGSLPASELRALAARKSAEYAARQNGRKADVVVVGRGTGLTEDYLSVAISDHRFARRERFTATLALDGDRLTAVPESLSAE